MKRHGLMAGMLLATLAACASAQQYDMPNAYQGECDECRLLPGLRTLLASHMAPVQNCGCGVGCCQKGCCQKSCCQKSVCQKSCCQKSCCQKSCCVQKPCCAQKMPIQKSPCQKSVCQKSPCQKSCGKGGCGLGTGSLLTMLLGQRCCSDCCGMDAGYAPGPSAVIEEDIPQPRVEGSNPFRDDPVMRPTSYAGRSVMSRR